MEVPSPISNNQPATPRIEPSRTTTINSNNNNNRATLGGHSSQLPPQQQQKHQQQGTAIAPPGLGKGMMHAAMGQQQGPASTAAVGEAPPRNIASLVPPPIPKPVLPAVGGMGVTGHPPPAETGSSGSIVPAVGPGGSRGAIESLRNNSLEGNGVAVAPNHTAAAATTSSAAVVPGAPAIVFGIQQQEQLASRGGAAEVSNVSNPNNKTAVAAAAVSLPPPPAAAAAAGGGKISPAGGVSTMADGGSEVVTNSRIHINSSGSGSIISSINSNNIINSSSASRKRSAAAAGIGEGGEEDGGGGDGEATTAAAAGGAGAGAGAAAVPRKRGRTLTAREAKKRARQMQLKDFLLAVNEYGSTVPGEATRFHLQRGGLSTSNNQLVTLMSLAADHLVASIVHDSSLYRNLRLQRPGERAAEEGELGEEDGRMLNNEDLSMSLAQRGVHVTDGGALVRSAGPAAVAAAAAAQEDGVV